MLGAAGIEPDVAELVQAEEVEAGVASHDPGELLGVGCFGEFVDQRRGGDVPDAVSLFGRRGPQGDEEVGLPGPGVLEEDEG